jgi:hypothetical protein
MEFKDFRFSVNVHLHTFAAYLGIKYDGRVISGGRDDIGNRDVGGSRNSWHRWLRGANAFDMELHNQAAVHEATHEARQNGFHVAPHSLTIHVEVPW